MDHADKLVLSEVENEVFHPDRLTHFLHKMFEKTQSGRARLEEQMKQEKVRSVSAVTQLERLYDLVAKGLTDVDAILKDKCADERE